MANRDLRSWLEDVERIGELQTITGIEHHEEIGGLVDIFQRRMGNPAVMFDEIPGFPKGHRVIAKHPDLGAAHQHRASASIPRPRRWT